MRNLGFAALVLFAISCKGGGPGGTYSLDKAAMTKEIEAKVATIPAEQQAMAKMALELVKLMDIKLTLSDGGKGEMATTMPSMDKPGDKPEVKTEAVTWENKDGKIVISGGKQPISCTLADGKLTCSDGKDSLSFIKN